MASSNSITRKSARLPLSLLWVVGTFSEDPFPRISPLEKKLGDLGNCSHEKSNKDYQVKFNGSWFPEVVTATPGVRYTEAYLGGEMPSNDTSSGNGDEKIILAIDLVLHKSVSPSVQYRIILRVQHIESPISTRLTCLPLWWCLSGSGALPLVNLPPLPSPERCRWYIDGRYIKRISVEFSHCDRRSVGNTLGVNDP